MNCIGEGRSRDLPRWARRPPSTHTPKSAGPCAQHGRGGWENATHAVTLTRTTPRSHRTARLTLELQQLQLVCSIYSKFWLHASRASLRANMLSFSIFSLLSVAAFGCSESLSFYVRLARQLRLGRCRGSSSPDLLEQTGASFLRVFVTRV